VKARLLVGKVIKKIHQSRFDSGGPSAARSGADWQINSIEFTDGTFLYFGVMEGEGDYGVDPVYVDGKTRTTNG